MDFIHIYSYLYILTWQHSHTAQIVGRSPVECLLTSCTHTGLQGKVSYLVSTYFMHSYWTPSFIYLSPGSTFNMSPLLSLMNLTSTLVMRALDFMLLLLLPLQLLHISLCQKHLSVSSVHQLRL